MKKKENRDFAIIGLGRFGGTLFKELAKIEVNVLGIDKNPEIVQTYSNSFSHVIELDAIDEESLYAAGLKNIDYVVVSLGEDIETSILTTLILKEMGIPHVWVKAQDEYHRKVLNKIGADRIIQPERDMAKRIAHHIVSEKVTDYIEISKSYSIVEIIASQKIAGLKVEDVNFLSKYHCLLIAINRNEETIFNPPIDTRIEYEDILITAGKNNDLKRLENEVI